LRDATISARVKRVARFLSPTSSAHTLLTEPSIEVIDATDDRWVVALHGEHDLSTSDTLTGRLNEIFAEGMSIVIDLSDAEFIDSTIIRVILNAYRRAEETPGNRVAVVVPPDNAAVDRVMELTGLGGLLPVFPDRQGALDSLS
jgi:anti-sigma B factor antagonist